MRALLRECLQITSRSHESSRPGAAECAFSAGLIRSLRILKNTKRFSVLQRSGKRFATHHRSEDRMHHSLMRFTMALVVLAPQPLSPFTVHCTRKTGSGFRVVSIWSTSSRR